MPKISIVIPAYNTEQYLEKCLDSLVNQTLKDIEIILVNDGSTDNTDKIILKYQEKYSNIVYLKQENSGAAQARNNGIKKAQGEYLMFVDSDDWLDINACEIYYNKIIEDKCDILMFNFYEVRDEKLTEVIITDVTKFFITYACPWNKIIKRELFVKNGIEFPNNIKAYEDLATIPLYLLYTDKIAYLNDPHYYYLQRVGSLMHQTTYNSKLEQIFGALEHLSSKFTNENNEKYKDELEYIYIYHLLHGASLRFIEYDNYQKNIIKVIKVMKEKFPLWYKNKYFKGQPLKYKIICYLFYLKQVKLIKLVLRR